MRVRFGLASDAPVSIAQLRCTLEGCPPLETALTFWAADGAMHRIRLLKPVAEVERADIAWLISSLTDHNGGAWDCC